MGREHVKAAAAVSRTATESTATTAYDGLVAALDGVGVAACVFDAARRVVACGSAFTGLVGMDFTADGQPLSPASLAASHSADDAGALPKAANGLDVTTADGRSIGLCLAALPDGGLLAAAEAPAGRASSDASQADLGSAIIGIDAIEALHAMPSGFALYDGEDRLVLCNARYREYYDRVAEMAVPGAKFQDLVRTAIERGQFATHNADADEAYTNWRTQMHSDASGTNEIELASGRWLRVSEHRTSSGWTVGTHTDVTELKQRETDLNDLGVKLQQQNARFDSALNNMIQGLCMFDADQRLTVCNQRYLEIYGFSPDVVKPGISLREIMEYSVSLGNYSRDAASKAVSARPSHAQRREQSTLHQTLRDGRTIAVMHQPMADGGSVATYEDITERVRAEELLKQAKEQAEQRGQALGRANDELERQRRELAAHRDQLEDQVKERTAELERALEKEKEYNALHREFVSMASHEFRTPLAIIDLAAQRMMKRRHRMTPDDLERRVLKVRKAVSRMTDLIESTLSSSRADAGKIQMKRKPCDPVELLQEVIDRQQEISQKHTFEVDIEGAGGEIYADPGLIHQVFTNLMSNAVKYSPDGTTVTVTGWKADGNVHVSFKDAGVGIPADEIPKLFGRFFRASTSTGIPGTGIGLNLSMQLLEMHNGTIDVESEVDVGSTFTVNLPFGLRDHDGDETAAEANDETETVSAGTAAPGSASGADLRPQ